MVLGFLVWIWCSRVRFVCLVFVLSWIEVLFLICFGIRIWWFCGRFGVLFERLYLVILVVISEVDKVCVWLVLFGGKGCVMICLKWFLWVGL